ncbi:hypothetical protein D3C86_1356840 [compost metagenome]
MVAVEGEQDDGACVGLDQARGDDADHAVVPVFLGEHDGAVLGGVHLELGEHQGLGFDPLGGLLAQAVQPVELQGELARVVQGLGEEELEADLGMVHAAGGVDARPDPKADVARVDGGQAVDVGDLGQRLDAGAGLGRDQVKAAPDERAVDAGQGGHVRDGADGDQVQEVRDSVAGRGDLLEGRGEGVGDADPGEARHLGRAAAEARVDDGVGLGQHLGRGVVVGDDDLHAQGLGELDLLDRGDAVVHRDDQLEAPVGEVLEGVAVHAVAVFEAVGQEVLDVVAGARQVAEEQRGAGDPVGVVVAVDDDGLAGFEGAREAAGGLFDAGQGPGVELVGLVAQVAASGLGVRDPADGEHAGEQGGDAEFVREAVDEVGVGVAEVPGVFEVMHRFFIPRKASLHLYKGGISW